ncbi:MAG: class I SAM-dependent methyltransferase [Ignavibacteria bacterium]|nr:class I SAM-dependent methyltransferase [Ignavibacteria bacterium]
MITLSNLIEEISDLPANWHKSGSVTINILRAILNHASNLKSIKKTAETGSGKTTLLFSHLSQNHIVFTLDNWNSLSAVKTSNLFKPENVTLVEGPTQKTLSDYIFTEKFDIVLLDGPHGYPFPDLEYFYFYPHIEVGGLLLIDDIEIPTIKRMFEILKVSSMWELSEVVDGLAIFKRTNAPTINPYSDSWWLQGYNKALANRFERREKIKKWIPESLRSIIPNFIKKFFLF